MYISIILSLPIEERSLSLLYLVIYLLLVIAECLSAKFHVLLYKGITHKGVYSQIDITNIIFKKYIYDCKASSVIEYHYKSYM